MYASELIRRQQRPAQKSVWNVRSIHDKLRFDYILLS